MRPYKEIIENCSGTFIDCLKPTSVLLEHLKDHSVFNKEMIAKVQCRPNRGDRVRELLDFLKNLGPKSFVTFIEALKVTEQHFLANILAANIIKP